MKTTKIYNLYLISSNGSELIEQFDSQYEAVEKTKNLGKYYSDKLDESSNNALEITNSETGETVWVSPLN